MTLCNEFMRVQEMQAQAQLHGHALRNWQEHLQECAVCFAQQSAAQELQQALGSAPAPRVPSGFSQGVLQRARATRQQAADRPQISLRARVMLALNWVVVTLVCAGLAAMARPAENFQRSPVFLLPVLFMLGTVVLLLWTRWATLLQPFAQTRVTPGSPSK